MKQAKGFSLKEIDTKGSTFEMVQDNSEKDKDAIYLDIISDDLIPVATASRYHTQQQINKVDFYKAYQKLHSVFIFSKHIPLKEKSLFFELVGTMLTAGIPVIQAIRVFSEQTKVKYFKTVASALSYQLEKGQKLSDALKEYPKNFSEAEIGMIASGEATGRLNEVLKRLSHEISDSLELRSKIKSALIYPITVIIFVMLAVYAMLRFVIPQMVQLFTSTKLELPAVTKLLIKLSDFVVNQSGIIFMILVVVIGGVVTFVQSDLGKQIFHRLFLTIPVVSEFLKSIYQARFARSISNLLSSGVSIVEAVKITANSISNVVYKDKINSIAKDVSQGITISESIQDSKYFSNLTVSMMSVGEKTAQVDELAKKIAEYYELKAANMAENFSKLIQPFIILIVGGLVGAVILAIMLPMTELLSGIDSL